MVFGVMAAGAGLLTLVIMLKHVAYSSIGRVATINSYYHDGSQECGFFNINRKCRSREAFLFGLITTAASESDSEHVRDFQKRWRVSLQDWPSRWPHARFDGSFQKIREKQAPDICSN